MCIGGQDIPVTLRVDGGIQDGQWQSASDVRDTPTPQEEVQVTESTETEVMEPSSPLYKPVIERIDKLSERLPEKVAGETVEEMQPMVQHGFQMADRNQMNTMQMLDRIMRNTRPRRPFSPRGDGPLGKGGGRGDPRIQRPRYQTLHDIKKGNYGKEEEALLANQQVAGLAGLFGRPTQLPNFPKQQMATPMQPEVVEEQQQMEILGQPKQFAGGGIVNALMATPIGQKELRKYAEGGEIKFGDYIFDYGPTGDDPLDILRGITYDDGRKARFFSSEAHMKDPSQSVVKWGKPDIVKEITEDLTPVRRKPQKEEPHEGDSQVPGGAAAPPSNNVDYNMSRFTEEMTNPVNAARVLGGLASLVPIPGMGLIGAGIGAYEGSHAVDKAILESQGWNPDVSGWEQFWNAITGGFFGRSGAEQLQEEVDAFSGIDNVFGLGDAEDPTKAFTQKDLDRMTREAEKSRKAAEAARNTYGRDVDAYAPDLTTQSGLDVAEIAAIQEQAAIESRDVDMNYGDSAGPGGGSEGMGGGYDESDAGEMGEDD